MYALKLFILFICGIALSTASDGAAEPEVAKDTAVTEDVTPKPKVLDAAKCKGKGYQFYPSIGCYKIHERTKMWDQANRKCTDEGAYLAIVNDEHEAKELIRRYGRRITSSSAWIGIQDEEGYGAWRTVHGDNLDQLYRSWTNYSQSLTGGRACGTLNKEGLLLEYSCIYELNAICEKDV